MRVIPAFNLLAVLLPALVYAAAGHTAYSSYLRQVPAPPRTAQEAHAAVIVDAGQISQPPVFTELLRRLQDEGVRAAATGASLFPAGVTDAASAEAFQQQFDSMTPAQQMAMAQQMAAQMDSAMQPAALGHDDRKIASLLDRRQAGAAARQEAGMRLHNEWIAAQQRWNATHRKIAEEEYATLERTPAQCDKTADLDHAAQRVHQQYAARHLAAVQSELQEGLAFFERRRVLATDDAGFADQLAPLMRAASSAIARQGYSGAQNEAVLQLAEMANTSWKLHEHAATWWLNKLDDSVAHRCGGADA